MEAAISAIGDQLSRISQPAAVKPAVPSANDGETAKSPDAPQGEAVVAPVLSTPSPLIPVRNRRFSQVLSVETYRLHDRTVALRPDQVANLTTCSN
jgi:hypothetical protein